MRLSAGLEPRAFRAQPIDRAAASHRQHPRRYRSAIGLVAARLRPYLREHLLDDVFRVGVILQDAQRERVHEPRAAIVQLRKRTLITTRHAREHCPIGEALFLGSRRRSPENCEHDPHILLRLRAQEG